MLKRKWHGIPLALVSAVLVLVLIAGGALAAYNFTGMAVRVEVDEPLQVQYNLYWFVHDTQNPEGRWDESGWQDAAGLGAEIPAGFSAGDQMVLKLRMNNRANTTLTVSTIITDTYGVFSWSGFPQSQVIPVSNGYDFGSNTVNDATAADWSSGNIDLAIDGDAAPGSYPLTFVFTRE